MLNYAFIHAELQNASSFRKEIFLNLCSQIIQFSIFLIIFCAQNAQCWALTPIQIAVYDDKLEIFNCGYLPENWTIENLLGSHRSRPYNPDIANAFFRVGEIETWGRGIERIINGCKDAGCPEPTFDCRSGEIWTVFHYGETESIQKSVQKSVQKIISLIKSDPHITTQAIADQLGINRSGVARHIKRLQEKGVIRRVGPDKGGYWEITSDEK